MPLRTDLAKELRSRMRSNISGIAQTELSQDGLDILRIEVKTGEAAKLIGKPVGRYTTVSSQSFSLESEPKTFSGRAKVISEEILRLCPDFSSALVVGLGNRNITPDRLGPDTADRILATRHIRRFARELSADGLKDVSVIAAGVMGQTGIEAAEIASAVAAVVKPDVVIAVDALACSEYQNLGSCVQLCDTGISPGSGVLNSRAELSPHTMKAPTVAVGVPTVVDAAALCGGSDVPDGCQGMFVTPRNVDSLVLRMSSLLSLALNLALHPSLTPEEISSLT